MRACLVLAVVCAVACGSDDDGNPQADGTTSGSETTSEASSSGDDDRSTSSGGALDSSGDESSGGGSSGTGESTTTGEPGCASDPPIDASGFSPEQITIDRGQSGAAGLGDLDGDGLDDFVMAGMVVFGREGTGTIAAADIQSGMGGFGFQVGGAFVAAAGDVDDDGLPDALVGDPGADFAGPSSGRLYVIRGKGDTTAWELPEVLAGEAGLAFDGMGGFTGRGLDGVGDLDGDGLDDVVFAAPLSAGTAGDNAGRVYGLLSAGLAGVYDESDIGGALTGWTIEGAEADAGLGWMVSALGDVNGDGAPDWAVSETTDRIYVVFGGPIAPDLDQVAAGNGGYLVTAQHGGGSFLAAGDVDGDDRMDLVIAHGNGARVAYGKADGSPVTQDDLDAGRGGFAITSDLGVDLGDAAGYAGDINGDGYGDILLGEESHDRGGGRVYVVFGRCAPSTISLSDVVDAIGGFVIDGEPGSNLGNITAGVGDFNGDGVDDYFASALASSHVFLGTAIE